jgi:aldose sugar dehydrogenase
MINRLILLFIFGTLSSGLTNSVSGQSTIDAPKLYQTYCAACHGVNMEGAQHTPLKKKDWLYGRDRGRMTQRIKYGIPNTDMIPWSQVLSNDQVSALVDYIIESQDAPPTDPRPFPPLIQTEDYLVEVEPLVTEGFRSDPWGIEFVDENRALITERRGGLRWMIDGELDPQPIEGIPATTQYGDSGMLDLALDPDYANNGWVYIAYVQALGDPSTKDTPAMTRIIRGRVSNHHWIDQQDVFRLPESLHFSGGTRWGSRLLFDKDGFLYFSIGDIGRNDEVQQLDKPGGKLYRILPDGSIPKDNPFVGVPGAIESIFSIGNRNIQGLDQHPVTGVLWATEHGPMGGDELNIIEKGKNYGWPVISWGINYNGERISASTEKEGMEQPVKFWTPSPALCPLEFYTGDLFPKWKNQAFVGALALEEVKRLRVGTDKVLSEEILLKNFGRVRDIKTGPKGELYLVLNNPHTILRITPADS